MVEDLIPVMRRPRNFINLVCKEPNVSLIPSKLLSNPGDFILNVSLNVRSHVSTC